PTNWHFLSVTFDPEFDTPAMLKAYGERYQYDPAHWSFITGPTNKIGELAKMSDVTFAPENGFLVHNLRTLFIDANGKLQMTFPVGGNLSDMIVSEILKAATVNLQSGSTEPSPGASAQGPSGAEFQAKAAAGDAKQPASGRHE